jgi:MFS family permease
VVRILPLRDRRDLVFGKLFFPNTGNELDGIIAAFGTYAVGFLARPLGGIVFGHVGDRIGRKSLLQFSLVLIGVSTFLMGCLPSFDAIGYWAPALLVLLRFLQGFAVGGEWGGAILLVTEHSPDRSRAFWGAFPRQRCRSAICSRRPCCCSWPRC